MRPGSVVVDAASSDHGGNVAGSEPGRTIIIDGVSVIGGSNLPAEMAAAASTAYARNLAALLKLLVVDGKLVIDLTDEVQSADRRDPRGPGDQPGHCRPAGGRDHDIMSTDLLFDLTTFVLAVLVGFEVISKVPATLHTPLMSGRELDPRRGDHRRAADHLQRARGVRLHPGVRRHRLRRRQRGRRLRGHRPDARDVQGETRTTEAGRRRPGSPEHEHRGDHRPAGSVGWSRLLRHRSAPDELPAHRPPRQPGVDGRNGGRGPVHRRADRRPRLDDRHRLDRRGRRDRGGRHGRLVSPPAR